jgi:hypothetical protein
LYRSNLLSRSGGRDRATEARRVVQELGPATVACRDNAAAGTASQIDIGFDVDNDDAVVPGRHIEDMDALDTNSSSARGHHEVPGAHVHNDEPPKRGTPLLRLWSTPQARSVRARQVPPLIRDRRTRRAVRAGLLENPDVLREKVREQAEKERREFRNTDREA